MNISIITLVFPPETGSARRIGELSLFLAQQGHHVSVITGYPSYPMGTVYEGYRKRILHKSRWKDAVDLYRMYLYTSSKRQMFTHRMLHYLSFTVSAAIGGLFTATPDIVYVVSPPYFLGLAGWIIARLRKSHIAFDVQDFWPEAPIALGYIKNPLAIRISLAIEKFIYSQSDIIFAVSDIMKQKIVKRGVNEKKVLPIYNWVDLKTSESDSRDSQRKRLHLEQKFIVLFAGNIGQAQGLEIVIDAANLLRNQPDISFVILGDGMERSRLQQKSRNLALNNVIFLDPVQESMVPSYLGMADVLLVSLAPAKHREAAIPSKLQVYMANGKPVLASVAGATAKLISSAGCGIVVPPKNPNNLAKGVLTFKALEPAALSKLGSAGRMFAEAHFDKDKQCAFIEQYLARLVGK
jgi:colanic acid biosynthesis glycosyl transferase WcaI